LTGKPHAAVNPPLPLHRVSLTKSTLTFLNSSLQSHLHSFQLPSAACLLKKPRFDVLKIGKQSKCI